MCDLSFSLYSSSIFSVYSWHLHSSPQQRVLSDELERIYWKLIYIYCFMSINSPSYIRTVTAYRTTAKQLFHTLANISCQITFDLKSFADRLSGTYRIGNNRHVFQGSNIWTVGYVNVVFIFPSLVQCNSPPEEYIQRNLSKTFYRKTRLYLYIRRWCIFT